MKIAVFDMSKKVSDLLITILRYIKHVPIVSHDPLFVYVIEQLNYMDPDLLSRGDCTKFIIKEITLYPGYTYVFSSFDDIQIVSGSIGPINPLSEDHEKVFYEALEKYGIIEKTKIC